jgi:hypothetical protein
MYAELSPYDHGMRTAHQVSPIEDVAERFVRFNTDFYNKMVKR